MMNVVWLLVVLGGCGALTAYEEGCPTGATTSFADGDGDGFGDTNLVEETCGVPTGFAAVDGDCDDADNQRFPGNPEICDALDNDCNSAVDEGLPEAEYFVDDDGDGYGNPAAAVQACGPVGGRVEDGTDCDDADPANAPGFVEICDGGDNDCDTRVDDEDDSTDPASMKEWFRDGDTDGYGAGNAVEQCAADGQFTTEVSGDCNDANPAINPGAAELCAAADEDCDGLLGEADPSIDPADLTAYYPDDDQDGLGDSTAVAVDACVAPNLHVEDNSDCDDTRVQIGAPVQMHLDGDGDGYGDGVPLGLACPPAPAGQTEAGTTDCNDGDSGVYPGAVEICGDGIDQDCASGDLQCPPIGSFLVNSGPAWNTDPPVYSCLEACALLFGGAANDYQCSTSGVVIDNQAFVSGFGDPTYCTTPVAETFQAELVANPGYNCQVSLGCSYSAYVQDNCINGARNWCYPN